MERYNPNIYIGLNEAEIKQRKKANLVNYCTDVPTKSIKQIICSNVFTLFNLLNFVISLAILLVNSYKNLLFMGVVFCNTIISIIQEINSKQIIDKLSVIASKKVTVVRNGKDEQIDLDEIVLDDIIKLKIGNQIVTDAIIRKGSVLVDESFITGESEYIEKNTGDMLLSGSFVVSGDCLAQVEHIGEDNYTSKISKEAKYIKKNNSVIMNALTRIVKFVSIIIVPLGMVLLYRQYHLDRNWTDAIVNTAAAVISMIPEGLVLLTSTVLAVSIMKLGKKKVLVQDLYCIETLARVDTICLDKTGTLTEGSLEVEKIINLDSKYDCSKILSAMGKILDDNATMKAISNKFNDNIELDYINKIPFSSKNKYSGVTFKNEGTFIIGAPDMLCKDKEVEKIIKENDQYRILILMHSDKKEKELPDDLKPIALILITDKIRYQAKDTIEYFKKQGVDIKIISGDGINTVSRIAKNVQIDNIRCIDMTTVTNEDNLKEIVSQYNIFCRVSPSQKKDLILALKSNNHTVAMTGDGVNDVLALKEADCSIAMASGSDAARNVSQIVLLESNFDSVTDIVLEGRKTINNIERSATLFLTKTLYSTMLAILFLFISMDYPFQPIQLSLTSAITIGIPSFILALEPNKNKIKGNFFINVISKSIPSALTIVIDVIMVIIISYIFNLNPDEISTMAVILVAFTGFILLFKLCFPFNKIRLVLYVVLSTMFIVCVIGLNGIFDMVMLETNMFIFIAVLCVLDIILFRQLTFLCDKKIFKYKKKIV